MLHLLKLHTTTVLHNLPLNTYRLNHSYQPSLPKSKTTTSFFIMGFTKHMQSIFQMKSIDIHHKQLGSDETLINSSRSLTSSRTARLLKDRGVAARTFLSEKFHLTHRIPDDERYMPTHHLGSGGNGEVHLCRDRKVGSLVAVKTIAHGSPTSMHRKE